MDIEKRIIDLGPLGEARLRVGAYINGETAVQALDAKTGEPLTTLTVNLEQYELHPAEGHFFVKDYSENEGLVNVLIGAGVVVHSGREVAFGPYGTRAVEVRWADPSKDVAKPGESGCYLTEEHQAHLRTNFECPWCPGVSVAEGVI